MRFLFVWDGLLIISLAADLHNNLTSRKAPGVRFVFHFVDVRWIKICEENY
jgi:hypothetical protein